MFHEEGVHGATRSILAVLPALETRGWTVSFWVPKDTALERAVAALERPFGSAPRGIRYSWRELRQPPGVLRRAATVPTYVREFSAFLRARRPAVVHVNTLVALPEALIARGQRRPTVLHVHEQLPAGAKGAIAARLVPLASSVVATVSEASAARLREVGLDPLRVPNGVALPRAHRVVDRAGRSLVVGTLATVSPRKGSDVFVEAARRIASVAGDIEFRMVGPYAGGSQADWARAVVARARESGVRHEVVSDVAGELAQWDIFVLPSREDPMPLAVLEAMACGLPVIATRVDGIPELVSSETGLLVEPGAVDELVESILRLARSPELRRAFAAAARERVEGQFTLDRQADALDAAYRAALAISGDAS